MSMVEVVEAQLDREDHARIVSGLTDAYARDPVGGGRSLPLDVREAIVNRADRRIVNGSIGHREHRDRSREHVDRGS